MGYNATRKATKRTTYEGGQAYKSAPKLDLYLLAVTSLMSGDSFYEKAGDRLDRFRSLVAEVLMKGGERFVAGLAIYAREEMNLRTMPTLLVAELFLAGKEEWGQLASQRVWIRGDEHLEALAYLDVVGSKRPKSFLRGVASRLCRMKEYGFIKYGAARKTYSQKDAIRLSHPKPKAPWQSALFKYVVHGWDKLDSKEKALLPTVAETKSGKAITWEQKISADGSTSESWTEAIESMGYMALLRNLRNFLEKDVEASQLKGVAAKLADPSRVAKSRQLPFRFLSAMRALPTSTPQYLLDAVSVAADHAVGNVPDLEGDSLVLVDTSGSMEWKTISEKSQVKLVDAAACLGAILTHRGGCDLWIFGTASARVKSPSGTPVLATTGTITNAIGAVGHGTFIGAAIDASLRKGIQRIFVMTDIQSHDHATSKKLRGWLDEDASHRLYIVDLAGYGKPCFDPGHKQITVIGGFSEKIFEFVASMEDPDPLGKVEAYAEEVTNEN